STYGGTDDLAKVEERSGKPLSPYAVSKYVNELYADVFTKTYGMEIIGLRYFTIFSRPQDTQSTYAAAIAFIIKQLIQHQTPVINGTGENSLDFTYIDNVIQMNERALLTANPEALNQVYNTAVGDRTSLNQLITLLKELLTTYDPEIRNIDV